MKARIAASLYGFAGLCGIVLIVPAFQYMAIGASQSGFLDYVSLATSDWANLAGSWKLLLMSLAESVPIVGSVLVLSALFVLVYSIKKLVRDINIINTYRHATV